MIRKAIFFKGRVLFVGFLLFTLLKTNGVMANPCQGDIDKDGKVNGGDLMILKAEMGREDCFSSPCKADLNEDGEVNNQDREILKADHGRKDCLASKEVMLEENVAILQHEQEEDFEISEDEERDEVEKESVEEEIALPVTRFVDNGNGTVTDPATKLMWTKDANLPGDTMLFHHALKYIDEINSGQHANFGYSNWRLPTIEELRSLLDYTKLYRWKHIIPKGHPFENVQSLSLNNESTATYLSSSEHSWFLSSYCRLVGHNVTLCYGYVWPVRTGE